MLRARELRMHRWTKSAGTAVDPNRSGRVFRAAKKSSPESLFSPWPEKCSSTRSSDWLSANRSSMWPTHDVGGLVVHHLDLEAAYLLVAQDVRQRFRICRRRLQSAQSRVVVLVAGDDQRSALAVHAGSDPSWGCRPAPSSRVLRRHHVPYLRGAGPAHRGGDPLLARPPRSATNATVPGELVHVDVKKIGKIPDGGGWRAHGAPRADRPSKRAGIGYDYVHSMVDDHSRLAYSEILPDEKGPTCAGFITRAAAYFAGHGITGDRAGHHRQPLQLPQEQRRQGGDRSARRHGTSSSARTAPGRTARWRRFNRTLASRVGLPAGVRQQRPTRSRPCPLARAATTLDGVTPPSEGSHRSAACHQRDGRVH